MSDRLSPPAILGELRLLREKTIALPCEENFLTERMWLNLKDLINRSASIIRHSSPDVASLLDAASGTCGGFLMATASTRPVIRDVVLDILTRASDAVSLYVLQERAGAVK